MGKMRVLVKDKIADAGIEMLKEHYDVDVKQEWTQDELKEHIKDYDAVIVRSAGKITEDIIDASDHLKIIGRAGIGLDNVDIPAATKKGIIVANAPQSNIISAAEHALALLLAEARMIPQAQATLKEGEWKRSKFKGVELFGKTLGIVGLGRIGGLVASRARGFGMKVIAYDPYVAADKFDELSVEIVLDLEDLLKQSDFISIHLPKTPETKGFIGAKEIKMMKDGVRIVNAARGGIVDEKALYDALVSGKVGGAALDVFENEPPADSPLLKLDNVVATPHLGASTNEAQDKAGVMIAEQVIAALDGDFVSAAVNISASPMGIADEVKPYIPLAETLGAIFTHLHENKLNTIDIEYSGELADFGVEILTVAVLKGMFSPVVYEPVTFVNAPLMAKDRGLEVREIKNSKAREGSGYIKVSAGGKDTMYVKGSLGGSRGEPRITEIGGFELDLKPMKYMAFFRYHDRPGVIGSIGTMLGKNSINIGMMQVGLAPDREEAMMGLTVDQEIPDKLMKELVKVIHVTMAKFITL
ncbi:MAG: phosphoglycerate dehydrogenase [Actinomycetota bacterium]